MNRTYTELSVVLLLLLCALLYANRERIAALFRKKEKPKEPPKRETGSLKLGSEVSAETREPLPTWKENGSDTEQKKQKPHTYTKLIPESENIDLDCFTYFKGMRLLVVEDNLINQKIIQNVLKHSGIIIDIANNGREALEYLFTEHRDYDLILMDISMPVLDGIGTTKMIRHVHQLDHIPIVTFTAFSLGPEIEAMFKAGANAYLTKPLNVNQLYTVFTLFVGNVNRGLSLEKMLEIQGLDVAAGLEHAEGDRALYLERLDIFVHKYGQSAEMLPQWIEKRRYDRVMHECKELLSDLTEIGAFDMKALVHEILMQFAYKNEHLLGRYTLLYEAKMQALIDTVTLYLQKETYADAPERESLLA